MDVCDACVGEEALQQVVRDHAQAVRCDFCGRESDEPIAADLEPFFEAFERGLAVDWDDANNFMPRDGGDWAFPDSTTDIWDMLDDLGIELHPALRTEIIERFEDVAYAPRYFFDLAPDERLGVGWERFVGYVTHDARFLFMTAADGGDPDEYGVVSIPEMLGALAQAVFDANLVEPLPAGIAVHRARIHLARNTPRAATDLGAPPRDKAKSSNRMSPLGIPVFYGAFDRATVIAEVEAAGWSWRERMTTATFEPAPGFNILRLDKLGPVPSIFDEARRHLIGPMRFLHRFVSEVSRPVPRDEREHVEYVPTQIVAEYFRLFGERDHGSRVDGIAYRSSIRESGVNVAIFVDSEASVEELSRGDERKLALTGRRPYRRSPVAWIRSLPWVR